MNELFNMCVELLVWLAYLTGTSYVEINVIIFIIIGPIIFSLLVMYSIFITYKYRNLRKYTRVDLKDLAFRMKKRFPEWANELSK